MSYAASILLTLPELILTVGAIALLMVAAYVGDRVVRPVSWASAGLLGLAAIAAIFPAHGGGTEPG